MGFERLSKFLDLQSDGSHHRDDTPTPVKVNAGFRHYVNSFVGRLTLTVGVPYTLHRQENTEPGWHLHKSFWQLVVYALKSVQGAEIPTRRQNQEKSPCITRCLGCRATPYRT